MPFETLFSVIAAVELRIAGPTRPDLFCCLFFYLDYFGDFSGIRAIKPRKALFKAAESGKYSRASGSSKTVPSPNCSHLTLSLAHHHRTLVKGICLDGKLLAYISAR
jgi:hypothetical protein